MFNNLKSWLHIVLLTTVTNYYPALNYLSQRESHNNYCAVNYNINGTYDWGKYQLNDITFVELNQHYKLPLIDKNRFLNEPLIQEFYAIVLFLHHRKIIEQRGYKPSYFNDISAWGGVYGCVLY